MTNEEICEKLEDIYKILIKELNDEYQNNIKLINISIENENDPNDTIFIVHTIIDGGILDIINLDFAAFMDYNDLKNEIITYMKIYGVIFREKNKKNVYHKILKHNRSKEK